MTIVKFQRGITTKLYRQQLRFLCSACYLMTLYISMKFHDKFKLYSGMKFSFSNLKGE